MKSNLSRLLGQFGFGVANDLLAAFIVCVLFAASVATLALVGAL
jgi:hypothetical protein